MMKAAKGVLWMLLAVANRCATATPVDKVISLLTKLTAEVQSEGMAEAASYDKYACFCKDQADDKSYVIAKSDKRIKESQAVITALTAEMRSLDNDVSKSKKDVLALETTQAENQKIRNGENADYAKKREDIAQAIDAVETALETMKDSKKDVGEEIASLLQKLPAESLSSTSGLELIADGAAKPGEAKAYIYSSAEVIDTLQTLTMTFKKELAELDESEGGARGSFEMAAGARANTITALEKEIDEKEALSASKGEEKAETEELNTEETEARNADQAFLDELTSKCTAKAEAWDQRSTTRAEELTALTKGVELLKGMGDLYDSNKQLVGLISKGTRSPIAQHKQPVFLQLHSESRLNTDKDKLQRVLDRISAQAHSLNSSSLAMLALQLNVGGPDHFVKVRSLIKDLISKLKADAKSEATSKTFCDKGMLKAVGKRDKSQAARETANAQIDTTEANINGLEADIVNLAEEIANLNKEMLEATEIRAGDKANNEKTIENADAGKKAVDQAITILNKFYEGALLQASAGYTPKNADRSGKTVGDLAPDTFSSDEEYKGKQGQSKGIIGILEVISSDFEGTSKTTTSAEAAALKDFNTIKADIEKAVKDKAALKKSKETDVESKKSDLTGFKDDLKDANKMSENALEELDKLKVTCVDGEETYAERVAHRNEEIEALKQALEIFEDWQS